MVFGTWRLSALLILLLVLAGCSANLPHGAIVLTQVPLRSANPTAARDVLDERYPAGSRVVLVLPSNIQDQTVAVKVLSHGLFAAGGPVVSPDGQRILFVGKAQPAGAWQIYESKTGGGGRPRAITSAQGGAMDPAMISTGELVFSAPVPRDGETRTTSQPPALFVRTSGGTIRRLTFGATAAVEPTVLGDGRILFVSARAGADHQTDAGLGLFTINNDGTEVTAFALDRDGAPLIRRPRELLDGRIGFLVLGSSKLSDEPIGRADLQVSPTNRFIKGGQILLEQRTLHEPAHPLTPSLSPAGGEGARRAGEGETAPGYGPNAFQKEMAAAPESRAVGVHTARPFLSRTNLFAFQTGHCRSIEPAGEGALLACFETGRLTGHSTNKSFAVYRVARDAAELGEPIFDDPAWHDIEATSVAARPKPMGHLSTIVPAKTTGTILCLNANFTRPIPLNNGVGRDSRRALTSLPATIPGLAGASPHSPPVSLLGQSARELPTNGLATKAQRVRVLAATDRDEVCVLGETPLQADGSFMVEVPADVPLGFEALDGNGRVVRRLPPSIWVRPGENRSCLGCHEPPNRSSPNVRPLAASRPPFVLAGNDRAPALKTR